MKLVYQDAYGGPEVLQLGDVPPPVPGKAAIALRVKAVALTAPDAGMRKGQPPFIRVLTGLVRPKRLVLCGAFAATVDSVGAGVTRFKVGDEVFGYTSSMLGATAEVIVLPESAPLVRRPDSLTPDAAAGLAYSFLTAMPFLRDAAHLKPGSHVLINGAAGSVGIAAVQVAKYFDAKVTAVCSGKNAALVRSIGADAVLDYQRDDFTQGQPAYDVIFDAAAKSTFQKSRGVLKQGGVYLASVPDMSLPLRSLFTAGKSGKMPATALRSAKKKLEDLALLVELANAGKIKAITDRRFTFEQAQEAHRYVESGQKTGDVILAPTA